MPRPHPPEFRQRAVELARLREKPTAQIAADLGMSDSCLRNWMRQADIDEGRRNGLSSDDRFPTSLPGLELVGGTLGRGPLGPTGREGSRWRS
jgi:transposase-like protein